MITNTVTVMTERPYRVSIGTDILSHAGEIISETVPPSECVIVSDDTVWKLYGASLKNSLQREGFTSSEFVFEHGESSKSMAVIIKILDFFSSCRLTRDGLVIALGGGVVGDIAGFAASVYLRGVPFIQIPTTLLAAIDSSVGGKNGVNSAFGKNQIGTFYQPRAVICDTSTLETLPYPIFCDGIAEAIKYGAIKNKGLFDELSKKCYNTNELIAECVKIKAELVVADEFDKGERMLLNFGHTAAHSIEKLSEYTVTHGQAVAIGMQIAANASVKLGYSSQCGVLMQNALREWGFTQRCIYTTEQLVRAALSDKKRSSDSITLVMLRSIGDAFLCPVKIEGLAEFFSC